MGRYAGWIALFAGVAATADVILIPEIPYDIHKVAAKVRQRDEAGRKFSIIVVSEGAKPVGGELTIIGKAIGQAERLGGVGHKVGDALQELCGKETRVVKLGHLLRGGTPTATDRLLSLRFGAAAVRALAEGYANVMVALDPPTVRYVPLEKVAGRMKTVPLDSDTLLTARDLGISFGD
jgi:6-phosphofructokinase 1